jgi:hypothetical protein
MRKPVWLRRRLSGDVEGDSLAVSFACRCMQKPTAPRPKSRTPTEPPFLRIRRDPTANSLVILTAPAPEGGDGLSSLSLRQPPPPTCGDRRVQPQRPPETAQRSFGRGVSPSSPEANSVGRSLTALEPFHLSCQTKVALHVPGANSAGFVEPVSRLVTASGSTRQCVRQQRSDVFSGSLPCASSSSHRGSAKAVY